MTVRFKKTPDGEVAILPRAEYDALLKKAEEAGEDAGTARLVVRARKELASGGPLIPLDVANRLAAGENPVRVLRQWRGMSQVEFAEAVGIGQGYLSDLESGKRKGPVELHGKFARALGISIELLIPATVLAQQVGPKRSAAGRQAI